MVWVSKGLRNYGAIFARDTLQADMPTVIAFKYRLVTNWKKFQIKISVILSHLKFCDWKLAAQLKVQGHYIFGK